MIQFFKDVRVDWLADRRIFIAISTLLMLAGLASAVVRQAVPGGTDAFNLGVDFKGGTVVTVKFRQRPSAEEIRAAVNKQGLSDAVIQLATDKQDEALIKLPQMGQAATNEVESKAQVDVGRAKVRDALNTFGPESVEGVSDLGPTDIDLRLRFNLVGGGLPHLRQFDERLVLLVRRELNDGIAEPLLIDRRANLFG